MNTCAKKPDLKYPRAKVCKPCYKEIIYWK